MVASLTKERPQATTNIFVTLEDAVSLVVKGNGIIHVIGFFEPENEDNLPFGEEDLDEDEESD